MIVFQPSSMNICQSLFTTFTDKSYENKVTNQLVQKSYGYNSALQRCLYTFGIKLKIWTFKTYDNVFIPCILFRMMLPRLFYSIKYDK